VTQRERRSTYLVMMGTAIVLFVSGAFFLWHWSKPVAVMSCLIALVIPPLAAIVANRRD
jgi:Sec-independent protein secretion pathway component TatC